MRPMRVNAVGAILGLLAAGALSGAELTLHPYEYFEGFETKDPVRFWASNGTYTVHSEGLTNHGPHSGTNAFTCDVTFGTATYLFLSIVTNVPNHGELRFQGCIRAEAVGSGAAASLGLNFDISPAPYSGVNRIDYYLSSTEGNWVTQEITDVVRAGVSMQQLLLGWYCGGAVPSDTGNYTDRIVLFMNGATGSHFTVYLDDLRLWGSVPDKGEYDATAAAAWANYKARIQADVNGMVSNIVHYSEPVTYPPDIPLYSNMVDRAGATSNSVAVRTYPWPADYATLLHDYDALTYLGWRSAYVAARPGESIVPYARRPVVDEKILPCAFIHRFPTNALHLQACPGEYEPASFILHARESLADVEVGVSGLSDTNGHEIAAEAVDVRVVKCWYQAGEGDVQNRQQKSLTPELLLKDDDLVRVDCAAQTNTLRVSIRNVVQYIDITSPDAVFPNEAVFMDATNLQPFSVGMYTNKELWVTVHVPADAVAGCYTGTVTVAPSNEAAAVFGLTLDVLPFTLERSCLDYGLYYRGYLNASPPGIEADRKTEAQYRLELENMREHGTLYPDFVDTSHEAERLAIFRETGLPLDRLFTTKSPGNSTNEAELAALKVEIQNYIALARSNGFTNIYFYGHDEWAGEKLASQRAAWQVVHEAGGLIWAACYIDALSLVGDLLDLPNLNGRHADQVAGWHALGKEVFTYSKPQVGVEDPYLYRDTFGFRLWWQGYGGVMDYAYQHGFGHMWNDYDHSHYRDHVFAYPTSTGVVDTTEWEGWRETVDDMRYLATLETCDARTEATIRGWIGGLLASHTPMDALRDAVIEEILARQDDADRDGLSNGEDTDDDDDGMPDDWEIARGLNPLKDDAGGDPDHDGLSNLQEWIAGTDPKDKVSGFKVQGSKSVGNSFAMALQSASGRVYRAEFKDDLLSTEGWTDLTNEVEGTDSLLEIMDPAAGERRFYRPKVELK